MTRMHAGFAGVVQDRFDASARLRPRRAARAGCRHAAWGRRDAREAAAARSGSRPSATCSLHGPRRYERAADEVAISQLWGDEEVAIAGVVRERALAAARRAADDRHGACRRRERLDLGVVVQPAVARRAADAGHARAAARQARPLRLRRQVVRRRRDARDRRLRAGLPRERAGAVVAAARARARGARLRTCTTCSIRCPPSSSCRCGATRLLRSTSPRTRPRPRRRAGGSRSTSCSRCSSRCCARATRTRSRRRSARPASWSRATARRCRSR